jgi:hypothetical protein
MHPNNRSIDHGVFEIGISRQSLEDPFEDALLGPSSEALEDRIPIAELRWQIAPGRTDTRNPKNCFQEPSVIVPRSARIANLPWQKRRHAPPLLVTQNRSLQGNLTFGSLESNLGRFGNPPRHPECQQALMPVNDLGRGG